MSVFNRKMFKPRNARNALNMSAGVMPVQKFNAGGLAALKRFNHGGSVHMGTRPRTMGTTSSMSGLPGVYTAPNYSGVSAVGKPIAEIAQRYISGQPISEREFSLLRGAETSFLAGNTVENLGKGTRIGEGIASVLKPVAQGIGGATGYTKGALSTASKYLFGDPSGQTPPTPEVNLQPIGGLRDLTLGKDDKPINPDGESPEDYNKRVNAAMAAARPSASGTFGQRVNSAGQPQLNIDYLKSIGIDFLDTTNLQTASSRGGPVPPSAFGKAVPPDTQIKNPFEDQRATTQRIEDERIARAEMDRIGSVVGNEEGELSTSGFLPTTTPSLESATDNAAQAAGLAAGKDIKDGDVLIETEATVDDGGEDDATPGTGTGTGEGSGVDGAPNTQQEINDVINKGTQVEQTKALDGFIKEFMDKAPGYEGADSGLILAKIGFAMAAGKSPNAIENIASALSDGADMLIKDKAKKDEFNRQLKLSAMQYGFTEVGKLRAEERLEARERRGVKEMVVGAGGTTYKGKKYKPNESIFIDIGDIRDGKMPENITNTATLTALANQTKATNALLKRQLDAKTISLTEYQKQIGDYRDAVTTAITSEVGIGLLEGAMVNTAEGRVTGISPAVKDMLNKGGNFFGMDLGKEYETLDDVRNAMRASLQDLIPVTLGASQSANSISNRDVDFLIEAYFGAGALTGGSLAFATTDADQMVKRLQRASEKMRDAQKGAFATMNTVTNTLTPVFQPGTQQSAIGGLSTEQQRLARSGLGASGTATFTQLGLTSAGRKDEQGRPVFKIG